MTVKKVFISHSSKDKQLATDFVNLLILGCGLQRRAIFCTSLDGQILLGSRFKDEIHKNLDESGIVLALISQAYYDSAFCMCEMGAAWMVGKDFIPIMVPPLAFGDLRAVIGDLQACKLDERGMDVLHDKIDDIFKSSSGTATWNRERDSFLKKNSSPIPVLKTTSNPRDGGKNGTRVTPKRRRENSMIRKAMETALADSYVEDVDGSYVSEGEVYDELIRYEELVGSAARTLRDLGAFVQTAFLIIYRGENLCMSNLASYNTEAASVAIGRGLMNDHPFLDFNWSSRKIKRASESLRELKDFLDEASDEFEEKFEKDNGYEFSIFSEDFWVKALGVTILTR